MKLYFLFFLVISLSFSSCAYRMKNMDRIAERECKKAKKQAELDFNSGIYKLTSYGLPGFEDWNYLHFKNEYAKSEYGIEFKEGGCIVGLGKECYEEKMDEYIRSKFGDSIYIWIEMKSKKIYPTSEYFNDNILPSILKDTLFDKLEQGVYDYNNESELLEYKNYILENIENKKDIKKTSITFYTDKLGNISNIKIYSDDNEINQKIEKLIIANPKTKPATYFGYPINLERIIWL